MDEYISREELKDKLKMWLAELEAEKNEGYRDELYENKGAREAIECCIAEIETLPSADVQPVKHGRWERRMTKIYACSECTNEVTNRQRQNYSFCPYCGAIMDGENDGKE